MGSCKWRPIKIIELTRPTEISNHQFLFHEDNLQSIFTEEEKCMQPSILSVTGPSHKRKVLSLTYLVDFFHQLEIQSKPETIDLTFSEIKHLWTEIEETNTSGIFVWSKPYKCNSSDSSEHLVLIMTIYEARDITEKERQMLLGLLMLTSSRLIEASETANRKSKFSLRTAMEKIHYAVGVKSDGIAAHASAGISVNQICFLTITGGRLLETIITLNESCDNQNQFRLFPHCSSLNETHSNEFRLPGELTKKDTAKSGRVIVVPLKQILGTMVLAGDLVFIIRSYISFIEAGEKYSADNFIKISLELIFNCLISEGLSIYDTEMRASLEGNHFTVANQLIKYHLKSLKTAALTFKSNLGGSTLQLNKEKHEDSFNYQVYLKFQEILAASEAERAKWTKNVRHFLILDLKSPKVPRFLTDTTFFKEADFRQSCSSEVSSKVSHFKQTIAEYYEEDDLNKEVGLTEKSLNEELELLILENQRRIDEDERRTLDALYRNVKKLVSKMGSKSTLEFVIQKLTHVSNGSDERACDNSEYQGTCCSICLDEKIAYVHLCGHTLGEDCFININETVSKGLKSDNKILCHLCKNIVTSTVKIL